MPISTTNTPRTVWQGNPPSSDHQPDLGEVTELHDEMLANGAAGKDLVAAIDRINALETVGATGAQFTAGGAVAAATTGNVTLSGEQTIDGVATSTDRVLVKDQTAPEENGIYVTASGAWARASDMDAAGEVQATAVYVSAGTTQGGMSFATYSEVTTLDSDAIVFVEIANNSGVQDQIDTLNNSFGPALKRITDADEGDSDVVIADEAGFEFLRIGDEGIGFPEGGELDMEPGEPDFSVVDKAGFTIFEAKEDKVVAGGFVAIAAWMRSAVTDRMGFLFDDAAPVPDLAAPLLSDRLFGVAGVDLALHRDGLLVDRDTPARIVLSGATGAQFESQEMVRTDFDALGHAATVSLRDLAERSQYGEQSVTVHAAAQSPVSGGTPTVLLVGDSIAHRGGGAVMDYWLSGWGYTPSWIGTLTGQNEVDPTDGATVLNGTSDETKPGHALADLTYLFTGRVSPLAPGDEAIYDGETIANKRLYNTMLVAESGEDPADVRNGYVLDFANYVSRHGLATPDMLVIGYGTNDVRDVGREIIRDHFFTEYGLVFRRWFASYPNKNVIVWMPGTAAEFARSAIWRDKYVPALKGLIAAATAETTANAGTGEVLVCPAWAMAAQSVGYDLFASAETADPDTGAVLREISDAIHPTGGTRFATLKAVAATIACADQGEY